MSSPKPGFRHPLLVFSLLVAAVAIFGPLWVPAIASIAPVPIVLVAVVVSLWVAAMMQKDWPRVKGMVVGSLVGAGLCALCAWLMAMISLQITSRVNTAVDFSKSLETTRDYIYGACIFFALLGGYCGTLFMWYWAAPRPAGEEPPAKGK